MKRRAAIFAMVLICGCQWPFKKTRHVGVHPSTQAVDTALANPFLPVIQPQKLTIWQITVPYGSVSGNEGFWKNVDEHALDAPVYDMLYKNGVRVGMAPAGDWDLMRKTLSAFHATSQRHQYTGADAQTTELTMRSGVVSESLFYFDAAGRLAGRTFDQCDNILAVSFEPSPGRPKLATRVTVHPVVRSLRTEIEISKLNNSTEVQYVHPQHLYELSLTADVPRDAFMVVAASPEARAETSLGHAFLTRDDQPEHTETVLLVLPTGFETPKGKP